MRRTIEDSERPAGGARKGAFMRGLLALLLGLVLATPVILAACSDRDSGDSPGDTPSDRSTPTSAPTLPPSTPGPLSPGLQKLMDEVASVRGLPGPSQLEVNLIARSELAALLDSLLTDEDREWFRNTTTLYRLLGHFRDDQDYETIYKNFGTGSVLGLYSPLHDALWVVHDDGETLDLENLPSSHKETLVHELVHAIQDYNFKLDELYLATVDDLDRGLAYTSAVEGDAVSTEQEHTRKFGLRFGPGRVWLATGGLAAMQEVPPSIVRELLFPYTTGVDWIREVRRDGTAAVDAVIRDPPRGTVYVLHPDLLAEGFEPAAVELPDLGDALGDGWERESGGQFGEFQVRNYLQLQVRGGVSATAAAGWQGDRYDVYVDGDESVAAFRLKFATEDDAREFADAQQELLEASAGDPESKDGAQYWEASDGDVTATASRNGTEVVFVIGSTREAAQKAMNTLLHG
jgi:hypothetical protein